MYLIKVNTIQFIEPNYNLALDVIYKLITDSRLDCNNIAVSLDGMPLVVCTEGYMLTLERKACIDEIVNN